MVEQVVPKPETEDVVDEAVAPPWMTILHNCDCHTFEQVVKQLQKAIACSEAEGWEIAWQVHNTGKAVVKIGPEAECVGAGGRPVPQSDATNASTAKAVAASDMNILRQGSPFSPPCSRSKLSEYARHAGRIA